MSVIDGSEVSGLSTVVLNVRVRGRGEKTKLFSFFNTIKASRFNLTCEVSRGMKP